MKRIFIAVNLPRATKDRLAKTREKWPDLPVRWTKPENLHITLAFVGYVKDEDVLNISNTAREIGKRRRPFTLRLTDLDLGPSGSPKRMIWANGEKSEELDALKNDLETALLHFQKKSTYRHKEFKPHITLARFDPKKWSQIPEKERFVSEEMRATFRIGSIEVMESKLKKSGAEYAVLESVELGLR